MRAKLEKFRLAQPKKMNAALYVEAGIVLTDAKRHTPVEVGGGVLRDSGRVDVEMHGEFMKAILSFGGAAQAYAIAVHEHLSSHSPPSWVAAELKGFGINWTVEGTGPKFLENAINSAMPDILNRLGKRLMIK